MSFTQPTAVSDLLNYRINRLLASSGALVTRLCEGRYGITRREWRLVCLLADGGAMAPSDLAAVSHLERPAVSRHITDLLAKKLLVRVRDSKDGRRAKVDLTARGRKLHAELFPQSVALNNRVLDALTKSELAALDESLEKLTRVADELVATSPLQEKADRRHGGSRRLAGAAADMFPALGVRARSACAGQVESGAKLF